MTAVSFYIFIILDGDVVLKRMKEEQGIILPESDKYGGSWKHLTHINFVSLSDKVAQSEALSTHRTRTHVPYTIVSHAVREW